MGPIWPSYFKDCSSVIVGYFIIHLYHLTHTVRVLCDCFCLCVLTVCGGLSQHCSNRFVLYPAADSPLGRGATQCFRPYSLQQEVTQTHSNSSHPIHIESGMQTLEEIFQSSSSLSQGHALHYEPHRDKVLIQDG